MEYRYFIIEDESLIPLLKEFDKAFDEVKEHRENFLDEWGCSEYVVDHHKNMIGVKDPRTFAPPKKLPKGWSKMRKFPGFVTPTHSKVGTANYGMLKEMNWPKESKVSAIIMNRIYKQEEKEMGINNPKSKPIVPWKEDEEIAWLFHYEGQQYYGGPIIVSLRHLGQWCILIPDPSLKYTEIPGCREIKRWEYEKAVDEMQQWYKNHKAA